MKDCPVCKSQFGDQQSQCPYCGETLISDPNESPVTPPPAKKKSRLGLYIGGGILGAAVIAGAILLISNLTKPMRKIESAASKTGKAFIQAMGETKNLDAALDAIEKINTNQKVALDLELDYEIPGMDAIGLDFATKTDIHEKIAVADATLSVGDSSLTVPLSLNDKTVALDISRFLPDSVFQFSLAELVETDDDDSVYVSDLLDQLWGTAEPNSKLETAQQDLIQAWTTLMDNAEPQEREPFVNNGRTWSAYGLEFQQADLDALKESVKAAVLAMDPATDPEDADEIVEEGFATVFHDPVVYINEKGYFAGLTLTDEDGVAVSFLLEGQENPWEQFVLSSDGEVVLEGKAVNEDGIFVFSLTYAYETIQLTYQDATGDFTYSQDVDYGGLVDLDAVLAGVGAEVTGNLKEKDGMAELLVELGGDSTGLGIAVTIRLGSFQGELNPLTATNVYDPTTMDMEELGDVVTELLTNMENDKEIVKIIEIIDAFMMG